MAAIDRAIVEGPMGGDASKMKDFGATIARYDLSTLYKVLFKLGNPSFIMKRVSIVYRTYIRGGSIQVTSVRDTQAVLVLDSGALPSYFCGLGVPGWFTAAIELSGGRSVDVSETECVHRDGERCVWNARWETKG
jgi:hypothetical protein